MSDDGITGAILKPLENLNDVIFIGLTMTACCAEFGPFVQKYESFNSFWATYFVCTFGGFVGSLVIAWVISYIANND
jgi:hypothetical protein